MEKLSHAHIETSRNRMCILHKHRCPWDWGVIALIMQIADSTFWPLIWLAVCRADVLNSYPCFFKDHSYALLASPIDLKARLSEALDRVESLEREKRNAKDRERRTKKVVRALLEDLRQKNLMNEELKSQLAAKKKETKSIKKTWILSHSVVLSIIVTSFTPNPTSANCICCFLIIFIYFSLNVNAYHAMNSIIFCGFMVSLLNEKKHVQIIEIFSYDWLLLVPLVIFITESEKHFWNKKSHNVAKSFHTPHTLAKYCSSNNPHVFWCNF